MRTRRRYGIRVAALQRSFPHFSSSTQLKRVLFCCDSCAWPGWMAALLPWLRPLCKARNARTACIRSGAAKHLYEHRLRRHDRHAVLLQRPALLQLVAGQSPTGAVHHPVVAVLRCIRSGYALRHLDNSLPIT